MKQKIIIVLLGLTTGIMASAMDLSLRECREMALQSDEDVRIAQNHVTQSDLDRGIARTGYLPKIDANGAAFYMTPNPTMGSAMDIQMRGVYMAGFSLTQPIFVGGRIIAANKLAGLGREIAAEQLEAAKMNVVAEAEKSYWMYVAVLSKIDMIRSYIIQLDSVYAYTKSAYELGMTTALNVSRVDSRRSELQYRLQQAQSGADLCRMALCRIIGVADTEPITPTENLDDFTGLVGTFAGIENRPELNMAQKNVKVQSENVKMEMGNFLPTIGLQLGWNAFGNLKMTNYTQLPDGTIFPFTQKIDYRGFVGALSVSVPLFHWGEGYRKVKKAKLEVENASLSLDKNRKLMELQAHQAYSNYLDGYNLIESARKAMNEADANLALMKEQYEVGLMTLTDLLEAQSQWHASYSNLIEAKTQQHINKVEYLRATGGLKF